MCSENEDAASISSKSTATSAVALIRGGEVYAHPGSSSEQHTGGHVEPAEPRVPTKFPLNSALRSGDSRTGKSTSYQYRKKGFRQSRTNCKDQHGNASVYGPLHIIRELHQKKSLAHKNKAKQVEAI